MKLINVTPVMTSANTPAPYHCYASSEYGASSSFGAWHVFGGRAAWASKQSNNLNLVEYIVIDFNTLKRISGISIYLDYEYEYRPRYIKLYGSNNGIDFIFIQEFIKNFVRCDNLMLLDESVIYSQYKFEMQGINSAWIAIETIFMYDNFDIPKNLTPKITDKITNNELFKKLSIIQEVE